MIEKELIQEKNGFILYENLRIKKETISGWSVQGLINEFSDKYIIITVLIFADGISHVLDFYEDIDIDIKSSEKLCIEKENQYLEYFDKLFMKKI